MIHRANRRRFVRAAVAAVVAAPAMMTTSDPIEARPILEPTPPPSFGVYGLAMFDDAPYRPIKLDIADGHAVIQGRVEGEERRVPLDPAFVAELRQLLLSGEDAGTV